MAKESIQVPLPQDLQPLHDRVDAVERQSHERIQNLEQQVSDLRERAARAEAQLAEAIAHNPASEEALRLATSAHDLAQQLSKSLQKLQKESAGVPEKVLREVDPPAAPPEVPPQVPPQDPPIGQERRKKFWEHLL